MQSLPLSRLTEEGLSQFEALYLRAKESGELPAFEHLLISPFSQPLDGSNVLERRSFQTRSEWGNYLTEIIPHELGYRLFNDRGFWTWLALLWIDSIIPKDSKGKRKLPETAIFILSNQYTKAPRHAARTTWQLSSHHGQYARVFLCGKMSQRGEFTEAIMARTSYLSWPNLFELMDYIFYSAERGRFKRGSTSTDKPGSIRRFVLWVQQLEKNYDIPSLKIEFLKEILSQEFQKVASKAN